MWRLPPRLEFQVDKPADHKQRFVMPDELWMNRMVAYHAAWHPASRAVRTEFSESERIKRIRAQFSLCFSANRFTSLMAASSFVSKLEWELNVSKFLKIETFDFRRLESHSRERERESGALLPHHLRNAYRR